jgi:hypothetical protein
MVLKFKWMAITAARLSTNNATLKFWRILLQSGCGRPRDRRKARSSSVAKGAGRIRTATEGYAGLPLSTWVRRHFKNTRHRKTTNKGSNGLSKLEMIGLMMRCGGGVHNRCATRLRPSFKLLRSSPTSVVSLEIHPAIPALI